MTIYFGENLKKLRKGKDLTQETLAEFLGVSFQAVSKWERNESYPDITLLPAIASFFNVTIDNLMGIDALEKEEKINEYINQYCRLYSEHTSVEVRDLMKKAISEFPGNYELLARYFNALISAESSGEYLISVRAEAQRVYDTIQNYCTVDSIRIWTKKLMCRYLRDLSFAKESGVTIADAEKILEEMPIMQNTRDYHAMFLYPYDDEKRAAACAAGTSEMLRLLGEILNRRYSSPLDFDENVIAAYIGLVDALMPDGDYGNCFHLVIYDYGYIAVKKYVNGDEAGALENFEKMCRLAVKFDEAEEIGVHTSEVFEGLKYDKTKTNLGRDKMTDRVKHNMVKNYPLTDEFRSSEKFREILDILG